MWDWILTGAVWVLFGLVIFSWIHWADLERDPFDQDGSSYLQ
jgi:TM2 domain-containing membrane protein YozV